MNFNEAITEVTRVTARPDQSIEAASAINRAISYCTMRGEFNNDMIEGSIPIESNLYGNTIPLNSLTRFRRFKYVKPTGVRYYLSSIGSDKVFTPQGVTQKNVYYVAGGNLTYILAALSTQLEVGYYTYPQVLDTVTNTTHWMLDSMPYVIIELAAAQVFRAIGDDSSAQQYQRNGEDLFMVALRDRAMGD